MTDNNSRNTEQVTSELVRDLINEKKADRRWRNIRFFIVIFILVAMVVMLLPEKSAMTAGEKGKGHVSLVRLDGMIAPGQGFSAEEVLPVLKDAFADKQAKGVVLVINSGGGTPVQASIMHDAIMDYKKKYHKKVVVVGEDLLASGAYYVAVAADKIYVNPNTITGSIGVIMKGFGFPDAMKKVGIERRVYTAGVNKDRLDPFLPQSKEDIAKIRQVIDEIHANFQQVVLEGRQGKLHADSSVLFTGDFWSGPTALKLGLVDALGNLSDVLHVEFDDAHYQEYTEAPSVLKSLMGQFGVSLDALMSQDEARILAKM
jgi:protease-4